MVTDTRDKKIPAGYQQTEVGVIPTDWGIATAAQVCELVVDCKNRTPPVVSDDEFAVARTPNVRNGRFVREDLRFTDERSFVEWTARAVPDVGDILITREAPLGEVCLVPTDLKVCLGQRMMLYRPDREKTDTAFLLYALMSTAVQNNLLKKIGGSTVGHAKVNDIRNLQVPLPPTKEEQSTIASVLSDADSLLEVLEKLISKKRAIKHGAMHELLTGKRRLPGFSREWEMKKLGEIAEVKDGTHQTPKYVDDGIPFYSVENVTNNNFSETKFISKEAHKVLTKTVRIDRGDILMTRIGSIGDCKLIDWDVEASFYVSLALLKPKDKRSSVYIHHFSKSSFFKRELEDRSLQWAVPKKINLGEISKVKINLPKDLDEQIAIAQVLSDMDAEIDALERRLAKYQRAKQGMMQALLTGKIRLPTH